MQEYFPVSRSQKLVLDAERLHPGSGRYTLRLSYTFPAAESAEAVCSALEAMCGAHQDLNVRFHPDADGLRVFRYVGAADPGRVRFLQADDAGWRERFGYDRPFPAFWDMPLYEFFVRARPAGDGGGVTVWAKVHHALMDGVSLILCGKRLEAMTAAGGRADPVPARLQELADREAVYEASPRFADDREYWANALRGTEDFPESILGADDSADVYPFVLDADLCRRLEEYRVARLPGLSTFRLALALLGAYLCRRCNSDAVPVVTALSGRGGLGPELSGVLSMLTNTIPLNIRRDDAPDFAGWARRVDDIFRQGAAHGRYPTEALDEDLVRRGEDVSRLRNFCVVSNAKPAGSFAVHPEEEKNASFGLTFRVNLFRDDRDGLQSLHILYRRSAFSRGEIVSMAEGIAAMAAALVDRPETPVGRLPIVGDAERRVLLCDLQTPPSARRPEGTFVHAFRKAAAAYPDHIALKDEHGTMTYAALDRLTDRLAALLDARGPVRGRFVALGLSRGNAFAAALYAVMKAGGAYLPLDPEYPRERVEYMLADSRSAFLITDSRAPAGQWGLRAEGGEALDFDALRAEAEKEESAPVPEPPAESDPAYIIYTSGSTGNPKGVVISHRALSALSRWNVDLFGLGVESRVGLHSTFSFDAAVMALFPPLTAGAQLHVLNEQVRFDPAAFYQYAKKEGLTDIFLTTQICVEFLRRYELPIRTICTGGEKLKLVPKHWGRLYNGYGPTECTVISTMHLLDPAREYRNIPIGKPMPGVLHYILDRNGELLPLGCPGELCLSGPQTGEGYWGRDEQTAGVFVQNPYGTSPAERIMYRTGDLAVWNADGEVEYLGRFDDQVKLRGFRIELGEIETAMLSVPGVTTAVAVVRGDVLAGYFMSERDVDDEEMRAALAARLPDYMVPSGFMRLDTVPMTPGGKVDRKKLPPLTLPGKQAKPPANELEALIAEVAAEIIDNRAFGVDTNLYQAGMSSLGAIKIAARLSGEVGVSLNAKDLMRAKTVEGIEALILQAAPEAEEPVYEKREHYPLSDGQLGVYYDSAKNPESLLYNIPLALDLPAGADMPRLVAAVRTVINAHPGVKAHLAMVGAALVQARRDESEPDVFSARVSEEELKRITRGFVRPFDLFTGPLYRLAVYKTPERVRLLGDFHHLVFDGASVDVLLRDLAAAYEGRPLAPEVFSAFEAVLAEQAEKEGDALRAAKAFYRERLAEYDGAAALPYDFSGGDRAGEAGKVEVRIDAESVARFCADAGLTPGSFFLGASALVISRFVSGRRLLLSAIYSGRNHARVADTFGMLVKTLPLALELDPAEPVVDYLLRTQDEMHRSIEHQACSFAELAQEYAFKPAINFAFQGGLIDEHRLDGAPVRLLHLDADDKAKFPFSIEINRNERQFLINLEYDTSLYARPTVETFGACLGRVAEVLLRGDTGQAVGAIGLMTPDQAARVASFNAPIVPNAAPNLHGLFERQAAEQPDQVALTAVDRELTFAELNRDANRLAHALAARGARREDRIAFVLSRTSRVFVAMLGIMKAGCAFIPVDPEYPADRVAHILSDSGARYILTHGANGCPGGLDIDELIAGGEEHNPELAVRPDDLAYIIYTSGSTGKPKGVMLTHRGAVNYVMPEPRNIHVRALVENKVLLVSIITVSFDAFLEDAFCTLMNGLPLVFASEEEANNPEKLAALYERTGGAGADFTPSRLWQNLELPALARALSRCRVITAGGEKYPPALYERLRRLNPGAILFNSYGPTETTIACNCKALDGRGLTIGAPLHNVVEDIVDIDGHPLPPHVIGELWIGGEGVAGGYFGNAEMTAERFIVKNGVRRYRSGDLGKWNDAGEIVLLGRNDGQIKLRGLRIELGEIESALAATPGIRESAVLVRTIAGREHLAAYYTADRPMAPGELRELLSGSLAKYMLPTAWKQLDAMPQTPSGKTDVKALPEAELMERREYKAPGNEAERMFCDIFGLVLEMDEVGADDNFFDLGGSSLLVTRVIIAALDKGMRINFGDVFANPTPEQLAALVGKAGAGGAPEAGGENLAAYDYSAINALLAANTTETLRAGSLRPLGNVLLTGATGFLGIHVLREFLRSETGLVYCLVRSGRNPAEARLKSLLAYYFEDSFDEAFATRIKVVEGDVTDAGAFSRMQRYPVDTVINCAANVKHFSAGTDIEDINVRGVELGAAFCLAKKARYIQISTTSIGGYSVDNHPPATTLLSERDLYFGQNLDNKYIHSKFLAERLVLEAAASKGLDAKIMRVGNLMARQDDGEFQINFNTNSFVGSLRAYCRIGCIDYESLGASAEFAPVDRTAEAILRLSETPPGCCVFHPYNNHGVFIGDVIAALNRKGPAIRSAELPEFEKAYGLAMRDPLKATELAGLIAYTNVAGDRPMSVLESRNEYTTGVLARLGFLWPITSEAYLDNFIAALDGLGFFENN